MMPPDALDVLRGHDAVLLGAIGDPSVPDDVSLWGSILPIRQRPRPVGEPAAGAAAGGHPLPAGRPRAGRRRHALRAREHGGRVRGRRRARPSRPAARGRDRDERLHAGGHRAGRPARVRARGRPARAADERDEVERIAVRLRALGRGRRGGGRRLPRHARTSGCSSTRSPRAWCATRAASTWSSPRTCSRHPHRPRRRDPGRDGHGREREHRAGHGRARGLRAGARLGAGHRRTAVWRTRSARSGAPC